MQDDKQLAFYVGISGLFLCGLRDIAVRDWFFLALDLAVLFNAYLDFRKLETRNPNVGP